MINTDFTAEAAMLKARVDQLQVEIDEAMDRHGVIHRAWQLLAGGQVAALIVEAAAAVTIDELLTAQPAPVEATAPTPRPPWTAPAKTTATVGGRPRGQGMDYGPIAAWINAAKADGTYSLGALAARFGVAETAAKNYVSRCRKFGLLDAAPDAVGAPAAAPIVAPTPAPIPAATMPAEAPRRHGDSLQPKGAKVLACTEGECEFECAIDKGHELNRHCLQTHGRRPHTLERTPVAAAPASKASAA